MTARTRYPPSEWGVGLGFLVLLAICGCRPSDPPSPLQAGEKLLRDGDPRAAIELLSAVPWSSPDVMAARRLVADIGTRIDGTRTVAEAARPRIERALAVASLPHDSACFTEGLEFEGAALLETCGLYQRSSVRRLDPGTGKPVAEYRLDGKYFAEGVTRFRDSVFVLTWREGLGLVLDPNLSRHERSIPLRGEGWGLTHDARDLIASDGSNEIRFLDPGTGEQRRSVKVLNGELPLMNLNELEYVNGELLANVFPTEKIARVDPASGRLLGLILAEGLLPEAQRSEADVMNGIAYDSATGRLVLTGKRWPSAFVVKLTPLEP